MLKDPLPAVPLLPWAARAFPVASSKDGGTTPEPGAAATFERPPARRERLGGISPSAPSPRHQPIVDEQDRPTLDPDALLAAAVFLDVLATRTRSLTETPTLLAELVGVAREVARYGSPEASAIHELAELGRSPAALERARAALLIAQETAGATPASAAAALRRIEAMAELVVRDACLRLAAADSTEYRQG